MRIHVFALVVSLVLPFAAGAAPKPESEDEKILYALGAIMARNVAPFSLSDEEFEIFVAGIRDQLAGREPAVPLQEYARQVGDLRSRRVAAAAEGEREAAAAFVAEAAAEEGAETTSTGYVYREVEAGDGPTPSLQDTVRVHYHGTLRDGTVFDSSVERGEPAQFPVSRVIPCWTQALQRMKVGTKAVVTCPAELAYQDRGQGAQIKPGAALRFEVELLGIE